MTTLITDNETVINKQDDTKQDCRISYSERKNVNVNGPYVKYRHYHWDRKTKMHTHNKKHRIYLFKKIKINNPFYNELSSEYISL